MKTLAEDKYDDKMKHIDRHIKNLEFRLVLNDTDRIGVEHELKLANEKQSKYMENRIRFLTMRLRNINSDRDYLHREIKIAKEMRDAK